MTTAVDQILDRAHRPRRAVPQQARVGAQPRVAIRPVPPVPRVLRPVGRARRRGDPRLRLRAGQRPHRLRALHRRPAHHRVRRLAAGARPGARPARPPWHRLEPGRADPGERRHDRDPAGGRLGRLPAEPGRAAPHQRPRGDPARAAPRAAARRPRHDHGLQPRERVVPPVHGVRADDRRERLPRASTCTRRSGATPTARSARSRAATRPTSSRRCASGAGFDVEFVGGYVSKHELRVLEQSWAKAIADARLDGEHRDFLRVAHVRPRRPADVRAASTPASAARTACASARSETVRTILVVYGLMQHPLRSTVEDHLYALRRYSRRPLLLRERAGGTRAGLDAPDPLRRDRLPHELSVLAAVGAGARHHAARPGARAARPAGAAGGDAAGRVPAQRRAARLHP